MSIDAVVWRRTALVTLAALLGLFLSPSESLAQNGPTAYSTLRSWLALDAQPGWEHRATDPIMRAMPEGKRDAFGNLILHNGSGRRDVVVACALDRPGFAVTEITDNGLLALARSRRWSDWSKRSLPGRSGSGAKAQRRNTLS